MTNLQAKLKLIIQGLPDPDGSISDGDMEEGLAQIETAFREAGWEQTSSTEEDTGQFSSRLAAQMAGNGVPTIEGMRIVSSDGSDYLSGSEWLSRFEKELPKHVPDNLWEAETLEAARKAAGIEDKPVFRHDQPEDY